MTWAKPVARSVEPERSFSAIRLRRAWGVKTARVSRARARRAEVPCLALSTTLSLRPPGRRSGPWGCSSSARRSGRSLSRPAAPSWSPAASPSWLNMPGGGSSKHCPRRPSTSNMGLRSSFSLPNSSASLPPRCLSCSSSERAIDRPKPTRTRTGFPRGRNRLQLMCSSAPTMKRKRFWSERSSARSAWTIRSSASGSWMTAAGIG